MPRSISGVYTLPEPAFVAGTVIQSAPVNSDFSDIASALTQSLATTGVSSMTGPIKAAAGTVTAPSYAFANALGTGWYLAGTNQIGWAANGVLAALFNADGSTDWAQDAAYAGDIDVAGGTTTNTLAVVASATLAGHPITNFPVGTVAGFFQTSAPTGWTKLLTGDDSAIKVTTGTVTNGGSVAFSTLFGRTAVDAAALTEAQLASHRHFVVNTDQVPFGGGTATPVDASNTATRARDTQYVIGGSATAATAGLSSLTGSGSTHTHNVDMRVTYLDMIRASKD